MFQVSEINKSGIIHNGYMNDNNMVVPMTVEDLDRQDEKKFLESRGAQSYGDQVSLINDTWVQSSPKESTHLCRAEYSQLRGPAHCAVKR